MGDRQATYRTSNSVRYISDPAPMTDLMNKHLEPGVYAAIDCAGNSNAGRDLEVALVQMAVEVIVPTLIRQTGRRRAQNRL